MVGNRAGEGGACISRQIEAHTVLTPLLQTAGCSDDAGSQAKRLTVSQDGLRGRGSASQQSSHLSFVKSTRLGGIDTSEAWGDEKREAYSQPQQTGDGCLNSEPSTSSPLSLLTSKGLEGASSHLRLGPRQPPAQKSSGGLLGVLRDARQGPSLPPTLALTPISKCTRHLGPRLEPLPSPFSQAGFVRGLPSGASRGPHVSTCP